MSTEPTDAFLAQLQARAAQRRAALVEAAPADPSMVSAYQQAAAVLHVFDPQTVQPYGLAAPAEAPLWLVTASEPAVGFRERGLRTLPAVTRRAALTALRTRRRMRAARAANPDRERTGVQRLFDAWLDEEPLDVGRLGLAELQWLRQLYDWGLDQFGPLPDRALVDRARARRTSTQMFAHLVDRSFVGRAAELAALRLHAGPGPQPGPLVVSGLGGSGKTTLLGRFLLDRAETGPGAAPFAYLTFDDPTLVVAEPATVLLAAAQQLNLASAPAPEVEGPALVRFRGVVSGGQDILEGFAEVLRSALQGGTVVLVLDTFEEVAYHPREEQAVLWRTLDHLLGTVPELRLVIAGRTAAARPEVRWPTTFLSLDALVTDDAVALLTRLGVPDPETARALADQVGGNPMVLRLAADVAASDPDGLAVVAAIGSELVRGQLYRRLLDHIHDPVVRTLAHPGMVLRRVTPELIREVLAPACGLEVPDDGRAEELFAALAVELALVSLEEDGSLRFRDDVRSPVLELLEREGPAAVRRIDELAVDFYALRDGAAARAEELYHRLRLGQPLHELDARWRPDVAAFLWPVLDELPPVGRQWLAARLGTELEPEAYAQVELAGWERLVGPRALGRLREGDPAGALALLGVRPERTLDSPLVAIEARAFLDLGAADQAAEVLDHALAGYPVLGNAGRLAELVWLRAQAVRDDDAVRLSWLHGLRSLVDDLTSPVPSLQVLTALLGVRNPDDRADPGDAEVGPLRRNLADLLGGMNPQDLDAYPALVRLALVRLGPHYPDLTARLAPAVMSDRALWRSLRQAADAEKTGGAEWLARELLAVLAAESARTAGTPLAGIDDYRETWESVATEEEKG